MPHHPRERAPTTLSRRELLKRSAAAGLMLGSGGALLQACAGGPAATGTYGPLPRPGRPVTWPVFQGNRPIPGGLPPERDATLRVYNWTAYINEQCLADFGRKYHCTVELTTFNTMNEALATLHAGHAQFDVFLGVTPDVLGQLIMQRYLRPLTHSYIPNIDQTWAAYHSPFYDQGWRYTAPYTVYTTGIAWRKDFVREDPYRMANAWAMPWQARYKGKVAILDDYRESISLGLMKSGIFSLNTTDPAEIATSQRALEQLVRLVDLRINNLDYAEVPTGKAWIHHAWSGDIAASPAYLPKGVPVEVIGYWFPPDGRGPVGNDTFTVLRTARSPVLAHLFINYMLDLPNALTNISSNGYMQPLTAITPGRLVKEKILPPSLMSTAVLPSYFRHGLMELELPATATADWQQAWLNVSSGVYRP